MCRNRIESKPSILISRRSPVCAVDARAFVQSNPRRRRTAMSAERAPRVSPTMGAAIVELQELVRERYPDATFEIGRSPENPETVLLKPIVDVEDRDEVMDVVIDRLGEL